METSLEQQIQAHAEQIIKTNMKLKDLEKQLDNYFIVSQKYGKLKKLLQEIKITANREAESYRYNGAAIWKQIINKINEVEDEDI